MKRAVSDTKFGRDILVGAAPAESNIAFERGHMASMAIISGFEALPPALQAATEDVKRTERLQSVGHQVQDARLG